MVDVQSPPLATRPVNLMEVILDVIREAAWLGLIVLLVFADVDTEPNDDHEGEDDDNTEDDNHDPVVASTASEATGQG